MKNYAGIVWRKIIFQKLTLKAFTSKNAYIRMTEANLKDFHFVEISKVIGSDAGIISLDFCFPDTSMA